MPKSSRSVPDRHTLYQQSVQCPEFELDFIDSTFQSLRKRKPLVMREDFCGTALSSCEWVKRGRNREAYAFDIDREVLEWGRVHNASELTRKQRERLKLSPQDVLTAKPRKMDVCQAFNFSYWVFQERQLMLKYFRNVHKSLKSDGVLFLDAFGGYEAHKVQKEKRDVGDFHYIWEQARYNAVTSEMQCKIHFKLPGGKQIKNAFTYTWRLWGAKEIREVLIDAGFSKTTLHIQEFDDETDEPLDSFAATDYAEDYACWIGYIVAEK